MRGSSHGTTGAFSSPRVRAAQALGSAAGQVPRTPRARALGVAVYPAPFLLERHRHCPFGLHDLLGSARPYIYVTMLRLPALPRVYVVLC